MSVFDAFGSARTILANLLGELIAPSRCAACDRYVAPDVLFCVPCAITNERVPLDGLSRDSEGESLAVDDATRSACRDHDREERPKRSSHRPGLPAASTSEGDTERVLHRRRERALPHESSFADDERVLQRGSALTLEDVARNTESSVELHPTSQNGKHAELHVAVFTYGGAISSAIARLKYDDRADLGPRLGRLMTPAANLIGRSVDLVVPVPLHPRRLAERGYNQAALLAAPIAQSLDVPINFLALRRRRDTPRQTTLNRSSRLANVLASFAVANPRRVRDRRIVLVDDVRTTGATLEACANALHEAGARVVHTLVLAKSNSRR